MAITRIGEATTMVVPGSGSSNTINTTLPSGMQAGDFLILEVGTGLNPGTWTGPTGWKFLRRTADAGTSPTEAGLQIWWKIAAAGEKAPTLTASQATRWIATVRVFRGVDGTSPFVAETANAHVGSATQIHGVAPLTNTDAGAWALAGFVSRQVATPYTATGSAGLTERVDVDTGMATNANTMYWAGDSNGTIATGTVNSYTVMGSGASAVATTWVGLLRPSTGSDTTPPTVPGSVTASADSASSVTLSWTASTDAVGVQSYQIRRGGTVLADISGTLTSYTDTSVAPSTAYSYTVNAVDAAGNRSADSTAASVTTPAPTATVAPFPTYVRPPDPYSQAIRNGIRLVYTVDASAAGVPITGATNLPVVGGSITDTTKPGVRRTLSLDLAASPGLFDLLAPIGTTLTVTAQVTYTGRTGVRIPMGVFDVDSQSLSEGGGKLSLTAPDKWQRIVRARFIGPASSVVGIPVTQQIAQLIRGALGPLEEIVITATSDAITPALTWEKDRDKAIIDLATGAGIWVYFDRFGIATIADLPTVKSSPDWLIDASPSGVLLDLDRQRSRTNAYNVVVVESSASAGAAFPTQYVWDSDSNSPTYAGIDPVGSPQTAGPFGIVPYYFDTPLSMSASAAQKTGATILAQTVGLASQVSLETVPNPAIDAFDALDVLPPRQRYDIARTLERHIADTVTHSLSTDGATHIDGRSTRTDAYS